MDIFEYVTAAILLILGIGVTQLLGDVVDAFRRRQTSRLHWIPLTWAANVFAWQMQFLWAVFELNSIHSAWSSAHFVLVLTLALLLFVSGSLVVPRATDESPNALVQFQADGRWSLLVLAVYFFLAYAANIALFDIGPLDPMNLEDLALGILLLVIVRLKRERSWAIATVIFTILSALSILSLSPGTYEP